MPSIVGDANMNLLIMRVALILVCANDGETYKTSLPLQEEWPLRPPVKRWLSQPHIYSSSDRNDSNKGQAYRRAIRSSLPKRPSTHILDPSARTPPPSDSGKACHPASRS